MEEESRSMYWVRRKGGREGGREGGRDEWKVEGEKNRRRVEVYCTG